MILHRHNSARRSLSLALLLHHPPHTMDSLHPPCTSLKVKYDSCWNHWFSEYLHLAAPRDDPKLSKITSSDSSKDSSQRQKEQEERQQKIRVKAQEYEDKCGDVWRAYRTCLNVSSRDIEDRGMTSSKLNSAARRNYAQPGRTGPERATTAHSGGKSGVPAERAKRGRYASVTRKAYVRPDALISAFRVGSP